MLIFQGVVMTQGTCGTVYRTNVRAPMFFLFFLRLGFLIIINPEIPLFNRDLYIGVSHIRYLGIGVHPCLSILDIQPYLFFAQKKIQRNCQTVCFFLWSFCRGNLFFWEHATHDAPVWRHGGLLWFQKMLQFRRPPKGDI